MSAYLELRTTGALGPAGAQLLYDTTAAVIRFDRLPPPPSQPAWTADDVREVAHNFLTDDGTPRRLASLLLRATDDDSLSRLLEAAVRNFLRDQARRTDLGAFRRRLREVLSDAAGIQRVDTPLGEAWVVGTVDAQAPPYTGDAAALDGAAWSIEAPLVRWRSESRRSPIADAEALAAVATAVIESADAPIPTGTLTEVGLRRFSLAATPAVQDLDDEPAARGAVTTDVLVTDRQAALDAFLQLSDRERRLLTVWNQPVRQIADEIGLGHSATAVAVRRLEALLTELLDQVESSDEVWTELQHLAHAWSEHRTGDPDASS